MMFFWLGRSLSFKKILLGGTKRMGKKANRLKKIWNLVVFWGGEATFC